MGAEAGGQAKHSSILTADRHLPLPLGVLESQTASSYFTARLAHQSWRGNKVETFITEHPMFQIIAEISLGTMFV